MWAISWEKRFSCYESSQKVFLHSYILLFHCLYNHRLCKHFQEEKTVGVAREWFALDKLVKD